MADAQDAEVRPIVDAVVLNWKDTPRTMRCLRSLLAEHTIRRVYLVDNQSDGTLHAAAVVLDPERIEVLELVENRGFAAGVNQGLSAALRARADQILCINNDAELPKGSLQLLSQALRSDAAVGMVAPVVTTFEGVVLSTGGRFESLRAQTCDRACSGFDYLTWACVLLSRELLESIGLLDERYFMYWEDVEFGLRARQAGFKLRVAESAIVLHEVSSSHARAGSQIALYSTAGLVVLTRQRGGLLLLGCTYRVLGRLTKSVWRLDAREGWAIIRGLVLGLSLKGSAYRALAGRRA